MFRNKKMIVLMVLMGCASLFLIANIGADESAQIIAEIGVIDVNEQDQISISMTFRLKNESENPIKILKWGTPFEGEFTQDIFDVINNGERAPYMGKLVKRLPPTEADFIEIAAKGELTQTFHLEDGYSIFAPGIYTVQYIDETLRIKTSAPDAGTESQDMKVITVQSRETSFEIVHGAPEDAIPSQSFTTAIECSDPEFNAINTGYNAARNIASAAHQALLNAPVDQRPQAQRYVEWFGAYGESRYATVTSNFNRVRDALFNQTINVFCPDDCSSNTFAYVRPSEPYNIYFCGAFFRAATTGTDSKAGTFVHELTHFTVVAGTDDIAYGQARARSLARTNPNAAIRNADSHEYFAENTPPLSMPTGGGGGGGDEDDDDSDSSGCFIRSLKK